MPNMVGTHVCKQEKCIIIGEEIFIHERNNCFWTWDSWLRQRRILQVNSRRRHFLHDMQLSLQALYALSPPAPPRKNLDEHHTLNNVIKETRSMQILAVPRQRACQFKDPWIVTPSYSHLFPASRHAARLIVSPHQGNSQSLLLVCAFFQNISLSFASKLASQRTLYSNSSFLLPAGDICRHFGETLRITFLFFIFFCRETPSKEDVCFESMAKGWEKMLCQGESQPVKIPNCKFEVFGGNAVCPSVWGFPFHPSSLTKARPWWLSSPNPFPWGGGRLVVVGTSIWWEYTCKPILLDRVGAVDA